MQINLMVDEWVACVRINVEKKGSIDPPHDHDSQKFQKKKNNLSNNHPQDWRFFHENHLVL